MDNVSTVSTIIDNGITWNIDSQGSVGICCHYKRPSPSRFSCGMAETSLPGQMVPTRDSNFLPARLEWRFGAVSSICKARSAIANWKHSITAYPRSSLLFVGIFAITTVHLSHDKSILFCHSMHSQLLICHYPHMPQNSLVPRPSPSFSQCFTVLQVTKSWGWERTERTIPCHYESH